MPSSRALRALWADLGAEPEAVDEWTSAGYKALEEREQLHKKTSPPKGHHGDGAGAMIQKASEKQTLVTLVTAKEVTTKITGSRWWGSQSKSKLTSTASTTTTTLMPKPTLNAKSEALVKPNVFIQAGSLGGMYPTRLPPRPVVSSKDNDRYWECPVCRRCGRGGGYSDHIKTHGLPTRKRGRPKKTDVAPRAQSSPCAKKLLEGKKISLVYVEIKKRIQNKTAKPKVLKGN